MSYQDDIRKMMGESPPEPKARADEVDARTYTHSLEELSKALAKMGKGLNKALPSSSEFAGNLAKAFDPYRPVRYEDIEPRKYGWHACDDIHKYRPPYVEIEMPKIIYDVDAVKRLLGELEGEGYNVRWKKEKKQE